jgi:hypothetical protein
MSGPHDAFTPFTLDNGWIIEFPTEPAGVLRLEPGSIHIKARFSEHYPQSRSRDCSASRLRPHHQLAPLPAPVSPRSPRSRAGLLPR